MRRLDALGIAPGVAVGTAVGIALGVLAALVPALAVAQPFHVRRLDGDRGDRAQRALAEQLRDRGHAVEVTDDDAVVVRGRVSARRWHLTAQRDDREESMRFAGGSVPSLARRAAEWLERFSVGAPSTPEPLVDEPRESSAPRGSTRARPARAQPTPASSVASTPWAEAPPVARLSAGGALFSRRLTYQDDLFTRLASNQVLPAPQLTASGAFFPLRALSSEPFAHVGVGFEASVAFLLDSYSEDDQTTLPTRAYAWRADLRYELPFDGHHLSVAVGFGEEVFGVDLPAQGPGRIPRPAIVSMAYQYVRPALEAGFRLHELVRVGGSVGWRALLSTGGLDASRGMPASEGGGWDAELTVALRLAWFFEARLRAGYHAYFFDFRPQPGEHYVVGGALDEWASVGLDAVVIIPGTSP